jgi:hypothetical protein
MTLTEDDLIERARRFLGTTSDSVSDETLRPACRRALAHLELEPSAVGLDWEVGMRTVALLDELVGRTPSS